jgi:ANTAR domain-containing protein
MTSASLYQSPTLPGGSAAPDDDQCDIAARRAAVCECACALGEQAQRLCAQSNALIDETEQLMRGYLRQLSPQARKSILSRSAFARLAARLETMPVIEQAKGIIMAQAHCGEARAFDLLRQASQRRNVPVRALAAQLVAQAAEPPPAAKLARPGGSPQRRALSPAFSQSPGPCEWPPGQWSA